MNQDLDRRLMRLLHGESSPDEAASTRQMLAGDPGAAARHRQLERLWNELEMASPRPADRSLLEDLRARLYRGESESAVALWSLSPAWGRAVAAAALVSGIGVGVWLGANVEAADEAALGLEPSLAESYWSAVEGTSGEGDWSDER